MTAPSAVLPLRRNKDFRLLWSAYTVTTVGSQVSVLALPLTAVLVLHAGALELGLLMSVQYLPFLLIGLPAGVWVDRYRRRDVMVFTDMARAVVLGLVPLLMWLRPHLAILLLLAFALGALTVLGDVAHQSVLPELLPVSQLTEGNSTLTASASASQFAGPSLGGLLVQVLSAPLALLADCVSFLVSAVLVRRLPAGEPEPAALDGRSTWSAGLEGLRHVWNHPLLRPIVLCTAIANFFDLFGMIQAVLVLFAVRELGLSPGTFGLVVGSASLAMVTGAVLTPRLVRRLGFGPSLLLAAVLPGAALLLLPSATPSDAVPLLVLSLAISGFAVAVYNISQVSLRQRVTPLAMQGRMNAAIRFLVWGTIPAGTLVGGVLGETLGLRPTLLLAALGSVLSALPIALSPVRKLRSVDDVAAAVEPEEARDE
ncbi:major facilitator superfamily permease [Streptomyces griseoaurantiacus M045]|uniref:Major facilitator superfamily permease n=1 Tax=Streptomyces griseoaurantiacus M045 TaxID=996637 RepID=F3N9K3_9ACTN|nr:MFS transporter [Streptomyces griseoaurantiacus]EGG49697.1 major facilitator superfamily permease [Streptomyces griseoaurantiacus M045]